MFVCHFFLKKNAPTHARALWCTILTLSVPPPLHRLHKKKVCTGNRSWIRVVCVSPLSPFSPKMSFFNWRFNGFTPLRARAHVQGQRLAADNRPDSYTGSSGIPDVRVYRCAAESSSEHRSARRRRILGAGMRHMGEKGALRRFGSVRCMDASSHYWKPRGLCNTYTYT